MTMEIYIDHDQTKEREELKRLFAIVQDAAHEAEETKAQLQDELVAAGQRAKEAESSEKSFKKKVSLIQGVYNRDLIFDEGYEFGEKDCVAVGHN
jgi:hypothetical protein